MSHQKQHAGHHACLGYYPRSEHSSPNSSQANDKNAPATTCAATRCTPPPCIVTSNQRPYVTRARIFQNSPHPTCTHETRQNANTLWTLCKPNGTSSTWANNIQLQKVNEQPGDYRSMANGIQKRLWRNGTMGQQNWAEGHKCNVCDDSWQNSTCTCREKVFTYRNPVVNYRSQKEFTHHIQITAGGNMTNYKSSASVKLQIQIQQNSIGTAW